MDLIGTLSGNGSLLVDRADGGVVSLGNNTSLPGYDNTFTGGVELRSGVLFLQRNTALGTGPLTITGGVLGVAAVSPISSPGTTVTGVPNAILLQADLRWGGNIAATLSGPISGAGGLHVDMEPPNDLRLFARTLTLAGASTFMGATRVEALNGLTLSGASGALVSTSGVTLLLGSQLEVDHRGDVGALVNRLGDTAPVTLHGATLNLIGASVGPVVETMGALRGGSGLSSVNLLGATGAATDPGVTLAPTKFSVASGSAVSFAGRLLGTATPGTAGVDNVLFADTAGTLAQLVGGGGPAGTPQLSILPGAVGVLSASQRDPASLSGASFVTYDPATGVRPLRQDTEYARTLVSGSASQDNVFLTTTATINADTTVSSMVVSRGSYLTGSGTLRVTSGMMILGGGYTDVARLDFGAQLGRVIVESAGSGFYGGGTISGAITGSGGVTFVGDTSGNPNTGSVNTIYLRGNNTFTGPLTIAATVNADLAKLGGTGAVRLDAGILEIAQLSSNTLARDLLVGEGGGSLWGTSGNFSRTDITLTGRLDGSGNLSFSASSINSGPNATFTLAGPGGDFSGSLAVAGATTLRFSNAQQLGAPREIVLTGGRLTNLAPVALDVPVRMNGNGYTNTSSTVIETQADLTLGRGISGISSASSPTYLATLTKLGPAVLRLQGDSTIQGAISVQEGTLMMNGSLVPALLPGVGLMVGAGARLGGNGQIHRDVSLVGSVAPGDFAPGMLTLDGDLTVGTAAAFEWEHTASAADLLMVDGRTTFSGGTFTLRLRALDGSLPSGADVLMQASDGFVGTLPSFVLDFTDAPGWAALGLHAEIMNGSLMLVPEPGTWVATLILGGGALFLARSRRGGRVTIVSRGGRQA